MTISGRAGIVLSSILFARQAQVERQNAQEARAEAEAAKVLADERAKTIDMLRAELSRITERLERLESGKV